MQLVEEFLLADRAFDRQIPRLPDFHFYQYIQHILIRTQINFLGIACNLVFTTQDSACSFTLVSNRLRSPTPFARVCHFSKTFWETPEAWLTDLFKGLANLALQCFLEFSRQQFSRIFSKRSSVDFQKLIFVGDVDAENSLVVDCWNLVIFDGKISPKGNFRAFIWSFGNCTEGEIKNQWIDWVRFSLDSFLACAKARLKLYWVEELFAEGFFFWEVFTSGKKYSNHNQESVIRITKKRSCSIWH